MTQTPSFADLQFEPHSAGLGGVRAEHKFDNGYSVSVIQTPFSYGGDYGLYELAVMNGGALDYTTPVTDDVEGNLSEADVTRLMAEVATLPASLPA